MTRTDAILEVSSETFNEIKTKLMDAGYFHCFDNGSIDMTGIALEVDGTDDLSPRGEQNTGGEDGEN